MGDSQDILARSLGQPRQPEMSTGYGRGLHIWREHEIRTGVLAWLPVRLIVLTRHSILRLYILYWSRTVHTRASCMAWQSVTPHSMHLPRMHYCASRLRMVDSHIGGGRYKFYVLTYELTTIDWQERACPNAVLVASWGGFGEIQNVFSGWGLLMASTRISRKIAIFLKTVSSTTYIKWSLVSFITFYLNSKHGKRTNIHVKR